MGRRHRRPAFTLIELLVVIGLIMLITALGAMAIPSAGDRNMQSATDKLQGWLLIAKQRAKRDGFPTGVRLNFSGTQATQCNYVQQPDDYMVPGSSCAVSSTTVTFTSGASATVDLNAAGVQAGDYLEFYRGGGSYQIAGVTSATALTLAAAPPSFLGANNAAGSTTEYRIRRQPVPMDGEDVLQLPDGVVIDQSKSMNLPATNQILFSPQGGLVGIGSGSDSLCVLWLSNVNNPATPSLLIAIKAHTGLIGVQAVNTVGTDPYSFCRDARTSGM